MTPGYCPARPADSGTAIFRGSQTINVVALPYSEVVQEDTSRLTYPLLPSLEPHYTREAMGKHLLVYTTFWDEDTSPGH